MKPKVAIVHEWLADYAGSEEVVSELIKLFPDAHLFTLFCALDEQEIDRLGRPTIITSVLQKFPKIQKYYRQLLPLMQIVVEQYDLTDYDIIISSSHAVAKGAITGPDQIHICMCHSPMRYAWDLQHQYLREAKLDKGFKSLLARWLLHKARIWDVRSSFGVDYFVANSNYISRRINKCYRRSAVTIYPPVDISAFSLPERDTDGAADFYFACSRFVPYKKMDLIAEAFTRFHPDKTLIIAGDGPDRNKISKAAGENVKLVGRICREDLIDNLQRCAAFIFAAEEDFGIIPVEAQACGAPVIAYGRGGALETVVSIEDSQYPTGLFFYEQTAESLARAVSEFESKKDAFPAQACRNNAERFGAARFRSEFLSYLNDVSIANHRNFDLPTHYDPKTPESIRDE